MTQVGFVRKLKTKLNFAMPIFMDRHDVSDEVTAEIVAELHQEDLKIQDKYNCKGLTYWFDAKRNTAFCLIEAPNKESIQKMHNQAHGEVPHKIIEVDGSVVESFLGRIEDPEKSQKTTLNIINDPAFRTIMVVRIKRVNLKGISTKSGNLEMESQLQSIFDSSVKFKGRIVKQKTDYVLISFDSVTNAVSCAIEIQGNFKMEINTDRSDMLLRLGLSAGVPVSEHDGLFEDTIQMAEHLCEVVQWPVVTTSEVRDLYESENFNTAIDREVINTLTPDDQRFLKLLFEFTEREWQNSLLGVHDFSRSLGYSKSKFYRKITSVTGKSPNSFLKEYRLDRALELMDKRNENVSEVAYETGFSSPAYFSKCFQESFGILPSHYIRSQ